MKIINHAEDKRKEKNTCIFDLLNKEIFSANNNIDLAHFFSFSVLHLQYQHWQENKSNNKGLTVLHLGGQGP